jgi:hypothetical protein
MAQHEYLPHHILETEYNTGDSPLISNL